MRILLIDDEAAARNTLRRMLADIAPEIKVEAEANNIELAYELCMEHKPDLVFLDVELGNEKGFSLLEKPNIPPFKVIFVTAHEKYSLQAIRCSALDFLLKPVDPEELKNAITKATAAVDKDDIAKRLETLLHNLYHVEKEKKKLVLKTFDQIQIIDVKDIVQCISDKNYTIFSMADGARLMVSKNLGEYEEMLSDYGFFRIHHSHLVNVDFISKYDKKNGGVLVLKDQSQVPVSLRKKNILLKIFESL
jgi:two-component system LytT family response regulator